MSYLAAALAVVFLSLLLTRRSTPTGASIPAFPLRQRMVTAGAPLNDAQSPGWASAEHVKSRCGTGRPDLFRGFAHIERFAFVCIKPFESYDLLVEIKRGEAFQIYRQAFTLEEDEMDVRKKLGEAMMELGRSLVISSGQPLVSVFQGGEVKVENEG